MNRTGKILKEIFNEEDGYIYIRKVNMGDRRYNTFDFEGERLSLVPLGDFHIGSPICDLEFVVETIDWIKNMDNVRVIGMGDYINNEHESFGVGSLYEQTMPPEEQVKLLKKLFMPIKDKILGIHSGNHERRTWRETGIDITRLIASDLGVPYLKWYAMHKIRVGKFNYVIFSTHGSTGARTSGGKINALKRFQINWEADLYLMGHVHSKEASVEEVRYVDTRNKCIKSRKKLFVTTGHSTNYEDGYAEFKNLKPSKKGFARIDLFGNRFDMHVSV